AFYAWGDFDLLEVFIQSVRIAHLDTKLNAAAGMVTTAPTRIMGLEDRFGSLKIGSDARLVCFPATSFNELISRPAQARELLGFADSTAISPDYTDLH
ncbi:MAG: cytosine deaminase, partial [Puniceicoccaceae bacterium]